MFKTSYILHRGDIYQTKIRRIIDPWDILNSIPVALIKGRYIMVKTQLGNGYTHVTTYVCHEPNVKPIEGYEL